MLQETSMNVIKAHEQISLVTAEIWAVCGQTDDEFDSLYLVIQKMASVARTELKMPRNCKRQTLRSNIPIEDGSVKVYWKRAVLIPYLDGLVTHMSPQFSTQSCQAVCSLCLLPANLSQCSGERIDDIIQCYGLDMPWSASAKQEIRIWKGFWADSPMPELPATLSSTLKKINSRQFPCISAVLNVLLLLPVTSAEVECAHSTFKLIKTKLRSTMAKSCLNALILLYFHKDIPLNYDAVIDPYT